MTANERLGAIARLIGEESRAVMLWHLLGERALTATELAMCADVSPQSASMHLNKLTVAGVLVSERQGRHRYFRIAGPGVANAIEAMAGLLPEDKAPGKYHEPEAGGIRYCRTCYDHLAGKVGVQLTERLAERGILFPAGPRFELTRKGVRWFESLGIGIASVRDTRRTFAKACLDWSERRHHLAGALGAAFLEKMLESDWIRRVRHSRAVVVTPKGRRQMYDLLKLTL